MKLINLPNELLVVFVVNSLFLTALRLADRQAGRERTKQQRHSQVQLIMAGSEQLVARSTHPRPVWNYRAKQV